MSWSRVFLVSPVFVLLRCVGEHSILWDLLHLVITSFHMQAHTRHITVEVEKELSRVVRWCGVEFLWWLLQFCSYIQLVVNTCQHSLSALFALCENVSIVCGI